MSCEIWMLTVSLWIKGCGKLSLLEIDDAVNACAKEMMCAGLEEEEPSLQLNDSQQFCSLVRLVRPANQRPWPNYGTMMIAKSRNKLDYMVWKLPKSRNNILCFLSPKSSRKLQHA